MSVQQGEGECAGLGSELRAAGVPPTAVTEGNSLARGPSSSKNSQEKQEGSTKAMLITSNYPEEKGTAFRAVRS